MVGHMADPIRTLTERLEPAFAEVAGGPVDPVVRRSDRADYQADGALALAKRAGRAPRDVAAGILASASPALEGIVDRSEIAGPGFINLVVTEGFIGSLLLEMATDDRLGVAPDRQSEAVVVDYSAPNVAKEMHVGHLRSTIIGDAIVRVLEFLGHDVIRQNHLGDWGTPFGMLLEHLVDTGDAATAGELSLADLQVFYQQARTKFDRDPAFAERSRQRVVLLQSGDAETLRLWRVFMDGTQRAIARLYDKLDVLLMPEDNAGESSYNDTLDDVVDELAALGLLQESEGALCLFPPGFNNRQGEPLPLIVRKSDGGAGYATTDLAAIRHRLRDLKATRLVYVVGLPQREHLAMIFEAARMAGWLAEPSRAEHVGFGSVLGSDRKMLRTRSGESILLDDLLDEAVERAAAVVVDKGSDLPDSERADVARAVGIGAVKYADLSNDRVKDYVFDWDRMLSLNGNTATYLQYAHARVRSIFRRGEVDDVAHLASAPPLIREPAERALALHLLGFERAVRQTAELLEPHRLAGFLFELASLFTSFYDACPVLRADDPEVRRSRLLLCDLTARTLALGLGLLGIEAPERM
jgi:arginyl-tRNA synthetase